jgi:hypothetical protein
MKFSSKKLLILTFLKDVIIKLKINLTQKYFSLIDWFIVFANLLKLLIYIPNFLLEFIIKVINYEK